MHIIQQVYKELRLQGAGGALPEGGPSQGVLVVDDFSSFTLKFLKLEVNNETCLASLDLECFRFLFWLHFRSYGDIHIISVADFFFCLGNCLTCFPLRCSIYVMQCIP